MTSTSHDPKRPMGRPVVWQNHVRVPLPVRHVYDALLAALASGGFEECHPAPLASLDMRQTRLPQVRHMGKLMPLPKFLATLLALPYSGRAKCCDTQRCCNPFHYLPSGSPLVDTEAHQRPTPLMALGPAAPEPSALPSTPLAEHVELLEYLADRHGLTPQTASLERLRELVPEEDLSTHDLEAAYAVWCDPAGWRD